MKQKNIIAEEWQRGGIVPYSWGGWHRGTWYKTRGAQQNLLGKRSRQGSNLVTWTRGKDTKYVVVLRTSPLASPSPFLLHHSCNAAKLDMIICPHPNHAASRADLPPRSPACMEDGTYYMYVRNHITSKCFSWMQLPSSFKDSLPPIPPLMKLQSRTSPESPTWYLSYATGRDHDEESSRTKDQWTWMELSLRWWPKETLRKGIAAPFRLSCTIINHEAIVQYSSLPQMQVAISHRPFAISSTCRHLRPFLSHSS